MKHYVAARPQCPTCGSSKLRNPRRAPAPIELGAGTKLVMTSGGYRTVSSRATVARFQKHVSPLTGVVSRLERIEADLPMNTNYYATHNFSAPAQNVNELRAGLSGGSFGKGSTAEQGEASALMEAIERYSGIFQGDEIRVTKRFTDFAPGDAILPNDVLLFSDAQSQARAKRRRTKPATLTSRRLRSIHRPRSSGRRSGRCATNASNIFRPASCIFSTAARPASTRISTAARPATPARRRSSRGSSSWWSGMPTRSGGTTDRNGRRSISASSTIPTSAICKPSLPTPDASYGCSTSPAISVSPPMSRSCIGCKTDGKISSSVPARISIPALRMLRTLTELNQFLSIGLMGGGTRREIEPRRHHPVAAGGASLFDRRMAHPTVQPGSDSKFGPLDNTRAAGRTPASTSPAAPASIFSSSTRRGPTSRFRWSRVIVPGLRHFYRRFGPGRLYDVPVKLGLRDRPLPESELTPFLPHT